MIKTIKVVYVPLVERVAKRFIKMFFVGAITSVLAVQPLESLSSVDLAYFATAILNGFLFGGLAALEKWINETK